MNNPVLNLLLNLNGTLSRKSYCAAVILLFVIIGIVVSKVSVHLSSTIYGYTYSDISGPATFSTFKSLVWICIKRGKQNGKIYKTQQCRCLNESQ